MPQLSNLYFVSSNRHKYDEAKTILTSRGISIRFYKLELEEIQSNSLKKIALRKSIQAYAKIKKPVIVEDDGLSIAPLNDFPGPYSSYVFKTIGNKGILNLLDNNREATFISIISYYDGHNSKSFVAEINGTISKTVQGMGWGYDPIFIPEKSKKTFAELTNKNELSHRYLALNKFANWYLHMMK